MNDFERLFNYLILYVLVLDDFFFFSSRRRHTRCLSDWSSDVCSSDLVRGIGHAAGATLIWARLGGRGAVLRIRQSQTSVAWEDQPRSCTLHGRFAGTRALRPAGETARAVEDFSTARPLLLWTGSLTAPASPARRGQQRITQVALERQPAAVAHPMYEVVDSRAHRRCGDVTSERDRRVCRRRSGVRLDLGVGSQVRKRIGVEGADGGNRLLLHAAAGSPDVAPENLVGVVDASLKRLGVSGMREVRIDRREPSADREGTTVR